MVMDKTRYRPLKLPTIEIAATRNAQVLQRQQRTQVIWSVIAICAVLLVGYFFAGVGPLILVLAVLAGVLGGSAIARLRTFGEHARLMTKVADSLDEEEANAWRLRVKSESRTVLATLIISAMSGFGIVVWVALGEGRSWVVLLCIVALAYALSSVKPLFSNSSSFMKFTSVAQQSGCRIALFRSFNEKSSSLARSALAPILAGYGRVDIVLDETFEHTQSQGVFGGEVFDFSGLCRVHRFANVEWKDRVEEIIRDCDITVVDSTTVNPGVMWELAQCYKYLPPYRVYLVIDAVALEGHSIKDHMQEFYHALQTHPEMPKNVRPYVFIFEPSAGQQEALATDIHRKMLKIIAIEEGDLDAGKQYSG